MTRPCEVFLPDSGGTYDEECADTLIPPTLPSSRGPDAVRVPRRFDTGATRDDDADKFDLEGFLSPLVLQRFAQYMHKHRRQVDGSMRASDNWQHGMPLDAYMKSGHRHFMDWWLLHRGQQGREGIEDTLCALLFNLQGYLFEILSEGKR